MTQPKPTAGEDPAITGHAGPCTAKCSASLAAKEAVESWRNGEVKLLTENPSEVGRYFSDFVLDGDKRLVEIFKQALLRFSIQQSEELVRALEDALERLHKLGPRVEPNHICAPDAGCDSLCSDVYNFSNDMSVLEGVLAAHHAKHQEGK